MKNIFFLIVVTLALKIGSVLWLIATWGRDAAVSISQRNRRAIARLTIADPTSAFCTKRSFGDLSFVQKGRFTP